MSTDQLALPLGNLIVPEQMPEATIQERFETFHAANPWVYHALVHLTREAARNGRKRVGIKHLIEVLRWEYGRATVGGEFRIDNKFSSRYARLLAAQHPEYADLFETRALRAA